MPQPFRMLTLLVQPPDRRVQPRPLGDDARQLLVVLAARGAAAAGEDARVGSEEVFVQDVVAALKYRSQQWFFQTTSVQSRFHYPRQSLNACAKYTLDKLIL